MTAGGLYIVAGEVSGDTHAAGLLRELLDLRPGLRVAGAGGAAMAAASGGAVHDWVDDAAVVGVWEVLRHFRWFRERFRAMLEEIRRTRPAVLVLVDYPGFNLRLAAAVRKAAPDIRIVYYISPQVWAWNKGRVKMMARVLDRMLCIFPFETKIFEKAGLPARFVGHPLVDELGPPPTAPRQPGLVGLFPGSREREVGRLFPVMIEAARRLAVKRPELTFEAPAASPRLAATMRHLAASEPSVAVRVLDGDSHGLMQRASCGVVASGTATLEAAWFGLPYCLVYKVAWPTYLLGRLLIGLPHIGLVNILAGREVVEELIQSDADPLEIERSVLRLLGDDEARRKVLAGLAGAVALLGGPGAHRRAAEAVAEALG